MVPVAQSEDENAVTLKRPLPKLAAVGVTVFWATMMGALVKREIVPAWISSGPIGYGSLLSPHEASRRSAMGIYFRQTRVGRAETFILRTPDNGLELVSRVTLSLANLRSPLLGALQDIRTSLTVEVGPDQALRSFDLAIRQPIHATVSGKVIGEKVKLTTRYADGAQSEKVVGYDARSIMCNALSPFVGMRNLKVGKEWRFSSFNPLNRRMTPVKVTVTARETAMLDREAVDVFVLTAQYGSIQVRSWVTPEGEVVRQETPFGLSLRREAVQQ